MTTGTGPKPTVLAIDDERLSLGVLHGLLRDECRMMVATDGAQGLAIARNEAPDLILLDVQMPGLSGHEVCRQLKDDPLTAAIPVIFITALNDPVDETSGFDLGAADYIAKPFNAAVVRARVRTQLRLKRQADVIAGYAFRDGLTGLYNRRSLDERLGEEWQRALRSARPLAVAMLDVDHFKRYNDHYGHGEGDECLRGVARALAGIAKRSTDFVARYGGEEFCLLMPDTELENALQIAESARTAVASLGLPHEKSDTASHVTISLGVASAVPVAGNAPAELLAAADRMLYQAKGDGRNRVRG